MNEVMEFVKPELLLLVPVLYFIGAGLKRSKVSDRWIPLLLGGAGAGMAALALLPGVIGLSGTEVAMAVFTALTQGILCAGLSVYINQLIKQGQRGKDDEDSK